MLSRPAHPLLASIAFVLIWGALFRPALFEGLEPSRSVISSNQASASFSQKFTGVESGRTRALDVMHKQFGRSVPFLWDPYLFTGGPLAANPDHAVLSPFEMLFRLYQFHISREGFYALRLAVAGIFIILFLNSAGAGFLGQLSGALGFCASGYSLGFAPDQAMNIYCLAPAMLWGLLTVTRPGRRRLGAIGLGLAWAGAVLGGSMQALVISMMMCGLFIAWRLITYRPPAGRDSVFYSLAALVAALVFAVGLSACFWAPYLEYLIYYHGALELIPPSSGGLSVSPAALFSPSLVWGMDDVPQSAPLYLGVALLVAAAFSISSLEPGYRVRVFFFFMTGVSVALLADLWPLGWIDPKSLTGRLMSARHAAPLFLSLSLMAGFGIDNLAKKRAHGGFAAILLLCLAAAFLMALIRLWMPLEKFYDSARLMWRLNRLQFATSETSLFLCFVALLAWVGARVQNTGPVVAVALLLIAMGEIWLNFPKEWGPPAAGSPPAYLRSVKAFTKNQDGRVAFLGESPPLENIYQLELRAVPCSEPIRSPQEVPAYWDTIGVRYLVTPPSAASEPLLSQSGKYYLIYDDDARIYLNRDAAPHVWFVPAVRDNQVVHQVVDEGATSGGAVADPESFNPLKTLRIHGALLEKHAELIRREQQPPPAFGGDAPQARQVSGHFQITDYTPHSVSLMGEIQGGSGWLVLSDRYDPGWWVFAEDSWMPLPIYRVNDDLRGVFLQSGQRRLVFRYIPVWFYLGLVCGLMTLLAALIIYRKVGGRASPYGQAIEFVALK